MAFTLDTYAHVLPGMQADAAEDLADRVFGPDEELGNAPDGPHEEDDEEGEEPRPSG